MSLTFAACPQDVLLEFSKQLAVGDLFAYLSVCRTTRELRHERTFGSKLFSR
ncbi:hypothetical protein B0H17DRAFT_1218547 [Mycena rosella]|uniref:F-box domain-containing protein n=1 Tax=Mycena rosella TaxID=1033263 RepID=A0AAD7BNY5_MYCRO|nr:hypothetical protein B0H17DRAFT_1218547 [Mycena rosella]